MRALRSLLARTEDVHCLVYHLGCLCAYALAFWWWLHPEEAGITTAVDRVAFVVAAAFLLGWISGVDVGVVFHNHAHRRVFTKAWMNRWATPRFFRHIWSAPLRGRM